MVDVSPTACVEVPSDTATEAVGVPRKRLARQVISKASIRRLAHDVGARAGKDALDGAMDNLRGYVDAMLRQASLAMSFSRKKSIALSHMAFAADVCGSSPESLRSLSSDHLQRLSKSNPQAPSGLRKDVLWRAEISEASFCKVMKSIIKDKGLPGRAVRVTSQARRLLQLLAEYQVMKAFDRKGALETEQEDPPMRRNFMRIFSCPAATADKLMETMKDLEKRIPALLSIGSMKTVDERLLRAALGAEYAWAQNWVAPEDFVSAATHRAVDRLLRASIIDKRVTASSGKFLAACLMRLVMESQGLSVPEAPPRVESPAGGVAGTSPVQKLVRAKKTIVKPMSELKPEGAKPQRAKSKTTALRKSEGVSPAEPPQMTA